MKHVVMNAEKCYIRKGRIGLLGWFIFYCFNIYTQNDISVPVNMVSPQISTEIDVDNQYILICNKLLASDSLSSDDFNELNDALFHINYYRSYQARDLYKKAIRKLQGLGLKVEAGILMRWMADMYYELSFLDSAKMYIQQASSIFKAEGAELEYARTANVRRLLLTLDNDFNEALKVCFEALDIFIKYNDEIGKAITFRDIGSIRLQEKRYSEALKYCLQAVAPLENANHWYELTFTYQRLALVYMRLQNQEMAYDFVTKAIDASKRLEGFRKIQSLIKKYWTKGAVYEEFGAFDQALVYYDSTKMFADEAHYRLIDKWLLNSKGNIYLKQEKYQLARDHFIQALTFIQKQNIQQNAYDYFNPLYENIIKAYQSLGRYKEANEYMMKLSAAKDSIFQLESEKQVAELQTRYETLQKKTKFFSYKKIKLLNGRS